MSKYAIIQLNGKQFQVTEGTKFVLDRLPHEENKELKISEVLLVGDEKDQKIGTPFLAKTTVTLKILENKKGPKIRVAKFRAKSRYRRVYGHRQPQSVVEVVKIST